LVVNPILDSADQDINGKIAGSEIPKVHFIDVKHTSEFDVIEYAPGETVTGVDSNSHANVLVWQRDGLDYTKGTLLVENPAGSWVSERLSGDIRVRVYAKRIKITFGSNYVSGNDYEVGELVSQTDGSFTNIGQVVEWIPAPNGSPGSVLILDRNADDRFEFITTANIVGTATYGSISDIKDSVEATDLLYWTKDTDGEILKLSLLNDAGTAGYTVGSDFPVGSTVYQGPLPPAYGDVGVTNDVSSAKVVAWVPGDDASVSPESELFIRYTRGEQFRIDGNLRVGPFGSDTSRLYEIQSVQVLQTIRVFVDETYDGTNNLIIGEEITNAGSGVGRVVEFNPSRVGTTGTWLTIAIEADEFIVGDTITGDDSGEVFTIGSIEKGILAGRGLVASTDDDEIVLTGYTGETIVEDDVVSNRWLTTPDRRIQFFVSSVDYDIEYDGEELFTPNRLVQITITDPLLDDASAEYTALDAYATTTVYAVGDVVTPGTPNGYVFRVQSVVADEESGGSEPTWNLGFGATTVDNDVTWVAIPWGGFEVGQYVYMSSNNPPNFPVDRLVRGVVVGWLPNSGSSILLVNLISDERTPFTSGSPFRLGVEGDPSPFTYGIASVVNYGTITPDSSSKRSRVVSWEPAYVDVNEISNRTIDEIKSLTYEPRVWYTVNPQVVLEWFGGGSPATLAVGDKIRGDDSGIEGYIAAITASYDSDPNKMLLDLVAIRTNNGYNELITDPGETITYVTPSGTSSLDYRAVSNIRGEIRKFSGDMVYMESLQTTVVRSSNGIEELQLAITFG
jgi:hypothetical protein